VTSKPTIERLLDAVDWKPVERPATEPEDGVPYATHTGILHVMDFDFECVVLNTGLRIITAESLARYFGCEVEDLFSNVIDAKPVAGGEGDEGGGPRET
jgi:hypothetical protein